MKRVMSVRGLIGNLVFGLVLVGAVGCSGQEQTPPDVSGSTVATFSEPMPLSDPSLAYATPGEADEEDDEIAYFYGTLQEYNQARMDCFERAGYHTELGSSYDLPSFSINFEGVPEEEQDAIMAQCYREVGEFYEPPATEESVTAEREWVVGQYNCLIEAGFDAAEPPSLESWLDEWRQKGYIDYDPMSGKIGPTYFQALQACPRTTETWPTP